MATTGKLENPRDISPRDEQHQLLCRPPSASLARADEGSHGTGPWAVSPQGRLPPLPAVGQWVRRVGMQWALAKVSEAQKGINPNVNFRTCAQNWGRGTQY